MPPCRCPLLSARITNCTVYGKAVAPFGAADIADTVSLGVAGTGDQVGAARCACRAVWYAGLSRPRGKAGAQLLSAGHSAAPPAALSALWRNRCSQLLTSPQRIITLPSTSYTPGAQYQLFARVSNALGRSNPSIAFEWTAPG